MQDAKVPPPLYFPSAFVFSFLWQVLSNCVCVTKISVRTFIHMLLFSPFHFHRVRFISYEFYRISHLIHSSISIFFHFVVVLPHTSFLSPLLIPPLLLLRPTTGARHPEPKGGRRRATQEEGAQPVERSFVGSCPRGFSGSRLAFHHDHNHLRYQ